MWYDSVVKYRVSENLLVSDEWKLLVTSFEGLRLEAYQDSVGVWTIGYGHTLGVTEGDTITKERALELLYKDVARFEATVNRDVIVPLTQYQFDALTSFTFNLGGGNLRSSDLLEYLNLGNYSAAANEFERWVYAGGKKLEGLVKRRKAEAALFRGEDWSTFFY